MPRAQLAEDDRDPVGLPVVTEPTLPPRRYGPEDCWRAVVEAVSVLPNLDDLRRRRDRRSPAPVRFRCLD